MLTIDCSGSPYEIGLKHGSEAQAAISRTIAFYADLFQETAKLDWTQVEALAQQFEPHIQSKWPEYLEEMRGIATGAKQPLLSILAINVRTEIAFGHFADGCTALAWHTPNNNSSRSRSFLAQNWDWQAAQAANLVHLHIAAPSRPAIRIITEAGLVGKIGLNAAGVGVCLNALKARGMDPARLPCHLALRRALEQRSAAAAITELERHGVAAACHVLVADAQTGGTGLECSARGITLVRAGEDGRLVHTNHYVLAPAGGCAEEKGWLPDSEFRLARMDELSADLAREAAGGARGDGGGEEGTARTLALEHVQALFRDESNFPASICRAPRLPASTITTLFNIVMDLAVPRAVVLVGRPTEPTETVEMSF